MRPLSVYGVVAALAVFCTVTCAALPTIADSGGVAQTVRGRSSVGRLQAPSPTDAYFASLQDTLASPIASMKRLPDGARVCVNRKCVTGVWFDHFFVQEADRSAGIKVVLNDYYPPDELDRGHLVSFSGRMATASGQRVVLCESPIVSDTVTRAPMGSLAMSSSGILGWPLNPKLPDGPRAFGLSPIGLYVKVWGRVTSSNWADDDGYYVYLDDGWGKKDGSEANAPGIRIYTSTIPNLGDFLVACGVLTTKVAYDPTPQGPEGDELIVPAMHTSIDLEPQYPGTEPVSHPEGPISGRVRLVGEPAPGKSVRIYSQHSSVVVDHVTDEYTPFTLPHLPPSDVAPGRLVTAAAPGYVSDSRAAAAGDTNVDFDLQPSQTYVEVQSDTESIAICSTETALIAVLLRDCEGKGLANRQAMLTTSKGTFVGYDAREAIVTTNSAGFAEVRLSANPDGAGVAVVRAALRSDPSSAKQVEVVFRGPEIAVTASPQYLTQSGASTITAVVTENELPVPQAAMTFKTDHGVFQETGTNTLHITADSTGTARATLSITRPGTARVLVVHTNACDQKTVNWTVVSYKVAPWYGQGVQYSNPLIADLYGDSSGQKQVVLVTTTGSLTTLSASGTTLWSKIMHLPGNNSPSCATLDGERSGRPCVFIPAESQTKVYGFSYDGKALAGWPAGSNYRFIRVAASIGDVNLDGTPEVVAGDECCYVFSWNPTGDYRKTGTAESSFLWRNLTGSSSTTIYGTTTALGDIDLDPDHMPDVICGSNHTTAVFAFPGDPWGDFISAPLYLHGYPRSAGGRVQTSPAIGDIDGDGLNDVALGSDDGNVYIGLSSDGSWKGYSTGGAVKSSPALHDVDGDGKLDVIIGSDSGRLFVFNWKGQAPKGWDQGIKLSSQANYAIESSPVVGDVTGDGVPEIVVGCNDGNIYALYADGASHQENGEPTGPLAWARCCVPPSKATAQVLTSPVIDDLDGDQKVEVLAAGDEGVYVFHFDATYDANNPQAYPWATFHRDNQRTGCATPLPPLVNASIVGRVTKGGAPALNTKIYVCLQDGSPVYDPYSSPPAVRSWVQTTGTADPLECGKGAYCISQLPANQTYKLRVEVPGDPVFWVENINVTTGALRLDIVVPTQ